jgi:hypothetical protein
LTVLLFIIAGCGQSHTDASVTTTTDALHGPLDWQAAMDRTFWYNLGQGPTPNVMSFSMAAGLLGTDRGFSIDLRPCTGSPGVLWTFGDVFWASGIGQDRTVPVADDPFHNIVALQRGGTYDLSRDTMQWSVPNIFPVPAGSGTVWPSGGICVNKQTIIVAAQSVTPTNTYPSWIIYRITNFYRDGQITNPNMWTIAILDSTAYAGPWPGAGGSWVRDGDYVYVGGAPQGGNSPSLYLSRIPFADLTAAPPTLANLQWWTASGWQSNPAPSSILSIHSGNDDADGDWGFYRRASDGKWVRFQIYQSGPNTGKIMYDVVQNLTDPILGDGMVAYSPPSPGGFPVPAGVRLYMAIPHPEQTWAGKRPNDVLITWDDASAVGPATDMRTYWPFLTKLAL